MTKLALKYRPKYLLYWLMLIVATSCRDNEEIGNNSLPYLGYHATETIVVNGVEKDTIIKHRIPEFELKNQYNENFGSEQLVDKNYLVEFFFTNCPSICPKVAKQMEDLHDKFKNEADFALVSFTLYPKGDTVEKLFQFAEKKAVNNSNWIFLTGDKDEIYDLANEAYFVVANNPNFEEDEDIMHKGVLVLVDMNGYIRGMYDGKDPATLKKVSQDLKLLRSQNLAMLN